MDVHQIRAYCLGKPGTSESRPFGPDALVIKVREKMFAVVADQAEPPTVSLKCEPELAAALRDAYDGVTPGYHLNKRHWNTVRLDAAIADDDLFGWIDDSYDLVVDGLPRGIRSELRNGAGAAGQSRPADA